MPSYKFRYFDGRALGEPIRLIFAAAGVEYEDERISLKDWPEIKKKSGNGQLPILYVDGKPVTQSLAICRYLAKLYDLIPAEPFLALRCDELIDSLMEVRLLFREFVFEEDELVREAKRKFIAEELKKYYNIFSSIVAENGGPFIAGHKLSWADLFLANWIEIWGELIVTPEFLNHFPILKKLKEATFSVPAVATYLASRPKSDF